MALDGRPRQQSGRGRRYEAQETLTGKGFVSVLRQASLVVQAGLALTHYVAKDDPDLLVFLPLLGGGELLRLLACTTTPGLRGAQR